MKNKIMINTYHTKTSEGVFSLPGLNPPAAASRWWREMDSNHLELYENNINKTME